MQGLVGDTIASLKLDTHQGWTRGNQTANVLVVTTFPKSYIPDRSNKSGKQRLLPREAKSQDKIPSWRAKGCQTFQQRTAKISEALHDAKLI